jgi:TrmH family RNA methyltransferase
VTIHGGVPTRAETLAQTLAERVVVVLVQPQHPGNVGATARAMKNFGLARLVVVAPPAFDPQRARWMAPGCDELIANARFVPSLDHALDGVHRLIASTARHRRLRQPVLDPTELADAIHDGANDRTTAILFGREDSGLDAAAVRRCAAIVRIPTVEHASLNLGQAVLAIARELFEGARRRGLTATGRSVGGSRSATTTAHLTRDGMGDVQADLAAIEPAVADVTGLLERIGYTRAASPEKVALTATTALQNSQLTVREVHALRGMVARVQWALDHPDVDWTSPRRANR